MVIVIDGQRKTVDVKEINGGIKSSTFKLPYGDSEITSVQVYNKQGKLTHRMAEGKESEIVGAWVPFTQKVKDGIIAGQLICN